ncbi:MAG: hypothetical protein AB7F43_00480 [Bacteriovoracia bacterium]
MRKFSSILGIFTGILGLTVGSAALAENLVWVGKAKNTKSCEKKSGVPLDDAEAQLLQANIKIFSRRIIRDRRPRILACGADKGDLNGFQIREADLEKATSLEFKKVDSNHLVLSDENETRN